MSHRSRRRFDGRPMRDHARADRDQIIAAALALLRRAVNGRRNRAYFIPERARAVLGLDGKMALDPHTERPATGG